MSDEAAHFAEQLSELAEGSQLVVVSGAGISLASGIPTFRGTDPDAVWKKDVTELGTRRYFLEDPVGSWTWYSSRFDVVAGKKPNPAHHALVELERWMVERGRSFVLVTQNIDTLHEDAGSDSLIKVHGSADQVRCSRAGCEHAAPSGSLPRAQVDIAAFTDDPSEITLPRCPSCAAPLRQHVLWFDEMYDEHESYQWQRVLGCSASADLMLFVGTSFAVGVTDLFLGAAIQRGIPAFAIDPGSGSAPHPHVQMIREPGEQFLPQVCAELGLSATG